LKFDPILEVSMKPRWSRPACGLIATLTALGTLAGAPTPTRATTTPLPAPSIHDGAATRATGTVRTVTLITGDQVTVFPSGGHSVTRGPGRSEVSFFTDYTAGQLSVIPNDAAKLLRAGRLDERLFNITDLIEQGYDDQRTELPLIVITEASGEAFAGARARFSPSTTAQIRELSELNAIALHERRVAAPKFWKKLTSGRDAHDLTLAPGIAQVWLDGIRQPLLDESVPQIGAPAMWRAGYTGKGVTVAVLDTGVDPSHPDLAGRVAVSESHLDDEDETDFVGHGTHVASIIAGSGAASDGRYRGVAPEARLVAGKVCAVRGCPESAILTGMRWAAGDQHATVVNMSLGGPDSPRLDPLEQAVEILTARYGTLFVVGAGNSGKDSSVNSPASAPSTLAVGAIDSSDALAYFSSRGPVLDEDGLKPDITAPGVDIMAARGPSSDLPGTLYVELSGTSMATPHVAGAAALLAQQHPDWAAQDLKATLMASATPNPSIGVYAQGAGQVDLVRAVRPRSPRNRPVSVSAGSATHTTTIDRSRPWYPITTAVRKR
jgi:subtilisin family serine protease